MQAVRHVTATGVTSLLDLTEQQWRRRAGRRVGESALFLLDAWDALESLRDGIGWEIEYPIDVAAAQAARHHHPGRSTLPARPAAVRPHYPALATRAGQTMDQAAAGVRAEHRRGQGRGRRAQLLQRVPHPDRR